MHSYGNDLLEENNSHNIASNDDDQMFQFVQDCPGFKLGVPSPSNVLK